jgi:hypothetical protein
MIVYRTPGLITLCGGWNFDGKMGDSKIKAQHLKIEFGS